MRTRPLLEGDPLPLVIEPEAEHAEDRSPAALAAWIAGRRPAVEELLTHHGALLLRGFVVRTPAEFEQVARALERALKNNYLGTSPRDALTGYVFSASELPPYYPIPQHIEMSFTRDPPRRIFFCCLVPPQGTGGETPLCDFRRVYRDLDPAVRARFEQRGVRNIRTYGGPERTGRLDWWQLKRWDEMFQTTDRHLVEKACAEQGFSYAWRPAGRLRLTHVQPAVRRHPQTGEMVWFNHSQVFHLSAAPGKYRRIAARRGLTRDSLLAIVAAAAVFFKRRLTPAEDQAMHCTYGDGSPIPDRDMEQVRDAIWRNLVVFRWQAGDVMMIDNQAVSHGRMPYRGPRQVVVCWA